jgi:ADP-ribose pyrophosphatase YjhB (NUDIX family)
MGLLDGWRFCPRCSAELRAEPGSATCPGCGSAFYANSEPTVGALVVGDGGRVLLARRAHAPFAGYWDLPGGFLEEGEHPLDALRRELREETGLEVAPDRFLGAWVDWYTDGSRARATATLNLYWTARVLGGRPDAADDVSELRWFARDELPGADALAFTNVALVLDAWRNEHP